MIPKEVVTPVILRREDAEGSQVTRARSFAVFAAQDDEG
jgi:hypothetical protein